MKKILLLLTFSSLFLSQLSYARTVEVDVYGMTCAFCVDSLEKQLGKLDSVSKVEVSLKLKKVRLESSETQPTIEVIKKTILDTGFTPIKVTILSNDKK